MWPVVLRTKERNSRVHKDKCERKLSVVKVYFDLFAYDLSHFIISYLPVFYLRKDRKEVDPCGKGGGEELGGV